MEKRQNEMKMFNCMGRYDCSKLTWVVCWKNKGSILIGLAKYRSPGISPECGTSVATAIQSNSLEALPSANWENIQKRRLWSQKQHEKLSRRRATARPSSLINGLTIAFGRLKIGELERSNIVSMEHRERGEEQERIPAAAPTAELQPPFCLFLLFLFCSGFSPSLAPTLSSSEKWDKLSFKI